MKPASSPAATSVTEFVGVPLSVVFADGDAIDAARRGSKTLRLEPPFHVSDIDFYLVVPADLGLELVDVFRDGDVDLVHELARDSVVVHGTVENEGKRNITLAVETCHNLGELLAKNPKHAETVRGSTVKGLVEAANMLDVAAITVGSSMLDDDSLASMLQAREYVGTSWTSLDGVEAEKLGIEPTYAWSKRLTDGRVGIEMALFAEYDELVAVLRPVAFAPA